MIAEKHEIEKDNNGKEYLQIADRCFWRLESRQLGEHIHRCLQSWRRRQMLAGQTAREFHFLAVFEGHNINKSDDAVIVSICHLSAVATRCGHH